MQNAGKHAGDGATVRVTVAEQDGALTFAVVDDGAGFEVAGGGAAGHGFVNMADRLGAFGGTLDVASVPGGGTTVRGHVAAPRLIQPECRRSAGACRTPDARAPDGSGGVSQAGSPPASQRRRTTRGDSSSLLT